MTRLFVLALMAFASASPAFAHPGFGEATGFTHGFLHPLGGLDHILAMLAVGAFAALLGRRALWRVPAAFVAMMGLGGALGMAGVGLPFVETGIGLSVVALGLTLGLRVGMPVAAAMAFVSCFAIFHGYAHGAEMPGTASGLGYATGFLFASTLLHGCGIGLAAATAKLSNGHGQWVNRAAGTAMALAGAGMLAGVV